MAAIRAVVRHGKIELDAPEDWAEGTEVRIEPVSESTSLGMREEDWPQTPEGIAARKDQKASEADAGLDTVYEILSRRHRSGQDDLAARHDEHQP